MNLSDMGFKNPDPTHPSDLAMESIAAQIPQPDRSEGWKSMLVKDGQVLHSGSYKECQKLRELVRQCGGSVSLYTSMESEQ